MRHHRHGLLLGKLTVDLINGGPGALSEGENGEASAPFYLVDEADKCSGGKLVVIVHDPEHRLLGPFVASLLGQDAAFFGSLVPMVWIVEMRGNWHGTRPFLGPHLLNSGNAMWFLFQIAIIGESFSEG